jgi:hypothetical protein
MDMRRTIGQNCPIKSYLEEICSDKYNFSKESKEIEF